ncbi:hypothetical protein Tco_1414792, partial [Tanacetum coccineum]
HLKVKLKAKEQPSPEAQILLNLKDKTESERDSDHENSYNDSEHGDESDKSDNTTKFMIKPHDKEPEQPPKELQIQSPSVSRTSAEDLTRYLNDPNEVQMSELLNEPLYNEDTTKTVTSLLETIQETQEHPAKNVTRLTNLEQGNNAEAIEELIQANVINEVKNQLLKFLPKAVYGYAKHRLERMVLNVMKKKPDNSFQVLLHTSIQPLLIQLYNALMNSMVVDESIAKGDLDRTPSQHKISYDGQDPPEDREGEKSKRGDDVEEPRYEEDIEQLEVQTKQILGKHNPRWFQESKKELPIQESVKLEYNMEQCHLALTYKIAWTNPKGNKFHHNLSKPLSLVGPPGRKKIPISYFFNHDLEYLKIGTKEKTYALSVTKIKAARYKDERIEEIIPYLWIPSVQKYNRDAELGIYH